MRAPGGERRPLRGALGRAAALACLLPLSFLAEGAAGQSLHIGLSGDRSSLNEVRSEDRLRGLGAAGSVRFERPAWGVEGDVSWRSLDAASDGGGESVTLLGGSLRGRYRVWRSLAVEAGFESRSVDPEFSAQDVAMAQVGLHYLAPLARVAEMWIRGAAIPWSTFSGGGEAGLGAALGMGVRAGPAEARWRLTARYDFQRLDRTVRSVDVPIQMESLRIGFEYAVF